MSLTQQCATVTEFAETGQDCVDSRNNPCLHLRLEPEEKRVVSWTSDTVDNENMGRQKSKCCCIYEKPRAWNESSSEEESDAECDHCYGHVEKKPKKKFHHSSPQGDGDPKENQSNSPDNN